ncbi:hypothetical protein [Nocardioides sp. zg-1228]|uniref:hypothetical protein n=1 Tax=Nocardioides sp. zg-1228 TaxID=2763008 RepID=UPI0016425522|nr:hypothetical protein [Nocardioides sp. zg-1228]MBC2933882.1 hypothetical protein [Nocardioides sp. zg-1228]QSF58648.1 hypothetical protein JX575_05495 [Nocardioides sp. zg-1228]
MSPGPRERRGGPRRVFLHIGLPKTGTTYLQQVVWGNRDRLLADGVLLPGFGHREHLWAALDLQERPRLAKRHPDAPGTWRRLVDEAAAHPGDVLITHEFLCGASAEQAARAVADFPGAEVHLVVTARDAASVVSAGWQESVKNGGTVGLDAVMAGRAAGGPEFSMRTWDLAGVLERWTAELPSERVHVLVMPGAGQPRDLHWRHFADVLGIDPDDYPAPAEAVNPALGIVQIETLRLVNEHLPRYSAHERGVWIRGYLAEDLLARQPRERGGMPAHHRARFAELDRAAAALIAERGFHVLGELSALTAEPTGPPGREPDTVTAEELLESASRLVADIVADVRASTGDVPPRRGNP